MRKISLTDQAKVRRSKISQKKKLVAALFTSVVLNYCIYAQGWAAEFDPWGKIEFQYNEYGKPCVKHQGEMQFVFNSSSSNDLMVIAVQLQKTTPIGVDVSHESQPSISPHNFMRQFEGIFHTQEVIQLLNISDVASRYIAFNNLWTLKEAFTKYVGCGLNVDLASFWFSLPSAPLLLRNAIDSSSPEYVTKYDVHWQQDITVDYLELPPKMLEQIGKKTLVCSSGVLRSAADIPVIISVVHEHANLPCSNLHMNFYAILSDLV